MKAKGRRRGRGILVHRTPLMEQWRLRISEFLGIDAKKIGTFGGTRKKPTGEIDVGMLPSLAKLSDDEAEEMLAAYSTSTSAILGPRGSC
jgi:superfamily II DNA or RNA helicase